MQGRHGGLEAVSKHLFNISQREWFENRFMQGAVGFFFLYIYTLRKLQKLIYLYLSTYCFMKIPLHLSDRRVKRNLYETVCR